MVTNRFKVCRIPSKGLGLVATDDIPPGQLILQESPLVSVKLDSSGDLEGVTQPLGNGDTEIVVPQLVQELNKMTDDGLAAFFSLSDFRHVAEGRRKTAYGILKTNGFGMDGAQLSVFSTVARINHSCQPNAHHYPTEGSMCVRKGLFVSAART